MRNSLIRGNLISRLHIFTGFIAIPILCIPVTRADPPATQPAAQVPADSPATKSVRDALIDWDAHTAERSYDEERKSYHTENDKESQYMDYVARENWEESKTQMAVRNKWGPVVEARFAHALGGSTLEDDRFCKIEVEGDHAVATWENIPASSPLHLMKVDGHWLVDGYSLYSDAVKDDPTKGPELHSTAKLMKQAVTDIAAGKFDDADSFLADFQAKFGNAAEGN